MDKRPFDLTLGMKLRGAYMTLHRRFNQHFRSRFDVTADQFVVLMLLSEEDGITQRELTRRSFSDSSTVGALLNLLEGKSLVRRETNPVDRRERLVILTMQGQRLQQQLWDSSRELHEELWSAVGSKDEERAVTGALNRVIDKMAV